MGNALVKGMATHVGVVMRHDLNAGNSFVREHQAMILLRQDVNFIASPITHHGAWPKY